MARNSQQNDEPKMNFKTYLANHNRQRNLDKVLLKWFMRHDNTNPEKSKESWDEEIQKFFSETEKK